MMKRKITCVLLLAFALLSHHMLMAQNRGVTVDGFCFLEQQTDHSGTQVLFSAVSPSAVTDSVFTASDGSFTAGLAIGMYAVEYFNAEYLPYTIPGTILFFTNTTLDDVTLLSEEYNISGSQSGIWEANKTYRIMSDVVVNIGDTLWIQPGVEVKFMENYKFDVYGTLLAVGNESDSIVFTSGQPVPASGDWQNIKFSGTASSASIIAYAVVQYGNYGIYCSYSSPTIQNNAFNNNNYGIRCHSSSPTIHNNSFNNNNSGIRCSSSSPTIQNNSCNNNGYGIYCLSSTPTIQNNSCNNNSFGIYCEDSSPSIPIQNNICNNNNYGIYCDDSSPTIQNNTICENSNSGIYTNDDSYPSIFNNIIAGNQRGVKLLSTPQSLNFNLFWENTMLYEGSAVPATFGQIVTQNANGDPCDTYLNLFMDPMFDLIGECTFEACTNLTGDENPENDCVIKTVTNINGMKKNTLDAFDSQLSEILNLKKFNKLKTSKAANLFSSYCSASTSTQDEYISNVAFGEISNSSGWQFGVANYTNIYTEMNAGDSESITVNNGNAWASDIVYVWIDWNDDFTFEQNSIEQYQLANIGGQGQTFVGTITCPMGTSGEHRMRVRMTYSTVPIPCGNATYGEIEDYTILVQPSLNNDVGVKSIVKPTSGINLNDCEPIIIKIKNYGISSQSSIPFSVIWSGNGQYNGTYTESLDSGEEVEITLPVTVNLSGYGEYTFEACTNLPGDEYEGNNCKIDMVTNVAPINDVGVLSILQPTLGVGFITNEPIVISIKNFGNITQWNIPYEVTWIGGVQNGSYSGVYEGILNAGENVDVTLPVTVDFTPNYHLQPTSPCIDAGNPAPAYFDPDGTIADIGAFYFDQGSAAPVINDFTADPVTGNSPLLVQFQQDITGPVTEYNWLFGDGGTSTLPNPVHVYTQSNTYDVVLMVTGPGGSDTKSKASYIQVFPLVPPLNAAFTATPRLGYPPLEVQFTNQSTGAIEMLLWDFGDDSTSNEFNPVHSYQNPGSYTVSLTAYSSTNEDTETKENYIEVVAQQEVVAMFSTTETTGVAPFTVGFFNESFGSVDSLRWDFGNGTFSTQNNAVCTFTEAGEYLVTLTVFGPLNTDTAEETIYVESADPIITKITDRPNDQGGYVYVQFKKSFYDNVIPGKSTESYTIQRQDNGQWVSLNTTLAYGEAVYTVEAATLGDSTSQSPGITIFRVIAGMDEGTWISQPGEGWSVDNIAPSTPDGMDWLITGSQLEFSWNPCPDEDFRYFAVYKSDENGLFPEIPVATLTGTSFSVEVAPNEVFIYAVTAFDFAGNESLFSEEISNLDRQEILIPQGWSGISGYLEPYNSQIENLFAPIAGNLTILMNETGMYWPGQNVNTLGIWQISQGYQIKMVNQTDFSIRGFKLTDHSLSLAAGWSLMPVLSENNTDVAALFSSTGLELIKEVAGFRIYWPAYGISTLSYLEPGRSYQVLMDVPGTIFFPTEPVKSIPANQPPPLNITSWNEIMPTPVSHAIAFNKMACSAFETGDMIAVFTSEGLCAGMQLFNSRTLGVVAFGDDGVTADKDGFLQGEALDFRLFRPSSGEQFNLEVTYDNKMNMGNFIENGISVVTSLKMSPLTPEAIHPDEISIFPNPSHGIFSLTGLETQASIGVFNAFGLEVIHFRISLPGEIDLSGQPKGIYFLQIKTGEGVFIKKLVLN